MTAKFDVDNLQAQDKQAGQLARRYIGGIAYPTIALLLLSYSGFIATLILFSQGLLATLPTIALIAVFTYFAYTPLHEAVHGNIHGGKQTLRWLNELCGYFGAQLIAVAYTSHRFEHFDHHRNTNIADKDPDYLVSQFSQGFIASIAVAFRFLCLQNLYLVKNYWTKLAPRQKAIYCTELAVMVLWRLTLIAWFVADGVSIAAALAIVLLGYFIGAYFTVYWFAYRPHHPYEKQERYLNTASLLLPRPLRFLEWFWLGQNLHSIHHLYPRVPFYRYRALHHEIDSILRAHGTPIIGMFNRKSL